MRFTNHLELDIENADPRECLRSSGYDMEYVKKYAN